jgi:hypothetical protein
MTHHTTDLIEFCGQTGAPEHQAIEFRVHATSLGGLGQKDKMRKFHVIT